MKGLSTSQRLFDDGFSLIELMVAMAIGAVFILGITQMFVAQKTTHSLQLGMSQIQEGGRLAVEMMSRDVRMADYWGCAKGKINVVNNLDINDSAVGLTAEKKQAMNFLQAGGIVGHRAVSGEKIASLKVVLGSDIITLRGAVSSNCSVTGTDLSSAAIQVASCNVDSAEFVVISDCMGGDIFQNTGAGIGKNLAHNNANSVVPGNNMLANTNAAHCNGRSQCLSQEYAAGAKILKPYTSTYFIAASSSGSGNTGLFKRDELNGRSHELINGVENMKIHYAVDTDYDATASSNTLDQPTRSANRWMTAAAIAADNKILWDEVIAIRVEFLLHSDDGVTQKSRMITFAGNHYGGEDNRRRQVYSATMNIRNRSIPSARGL